MREETADWIALMNRIRKPGPADTEEAALPESAPPLPDEAPRAEDKSLEAELLADEILLRRILGLLYMARKFNTVTAALSVLEIEKALGLEREEGTFIYSYMKTKSLLVADDKSRYSITTQGIDYLRETFNIQQAKL